MPLSRIMHNVRDCNLLKKQEISAKPDNRDITHKINEVIISPSDLLRNKPHYTFNNTIHLPEQVYPTHTLSSYDEARVRLETLHKYKDKTAQAFFISRELPTDEALAEIGKIEEVLFPFLVEVYSKKIHHAISYATTPDEISSLITDENWCGRQGFIYYDSVHAIYVDLVKNRHGEASLITINPATTPWHNLADNIIAGNLAMKKVAPGKLSILNLHADVQKSASGCKYFSLYFAKAAAKDKSLMELHDSNIAGGCYIGRNRRRILGIKETEGILGAEYYKHSQSAKRLAILPETLRKKVINVKKKETLMSHNKRFRIEKNFLNQIITFSNSIDFFRSRRIEDGKYQLLETLGINYGFDPD